MPAGFTGQQRGQEGGIVARSRKKVEVEDVEDEDVIEDLEDLDDLEALADSDTEEEEDDEEEDDDEEEAPRAKSKKKKAAKTTKAKGDGPIGSSELADALGTDGKNLRVMLRDHEVEKNDAGRYEWPSIKAALRELGFDDLEDAQDALAEARNKRLDALKERNAEQKASKQKKKAKARAQSEEDEDDVEDEDDEDEEPAPKRTSKSSSKRRTKKR
jgi:hypothetical protein